MLRLIIPFAGVLLCLGLFLLWRRLRPFRPTVHSPSQPAASALVAPSPEAPGPPPSPAILFNTAIRQTMSRAFTTWWRGTGGLCPGCRAPTFTLHEPEHRHHVSLHRGGGFVAWTQRLSCSTCGWETSFPHTDSAPMQAIPLKVDASTSARRRWTVRGTHGAPAGTITVGGGSAPSVEPRADATPHERMHLSMAVAQLASVADAVEPQLDSAEAARVLVQAATELLALHGTVATVEEQPSESP